MYEFFLFGGQKLGSEIDEPGCPAGAGCSLKGINPDNCLMGCFLKREAGTCQEARSRVNIFSAISLK